MIKSINQPWAISDKYSQRYGEIWTTLDFVFSDKISKELFKNDPMNLIIGQLCIYKQRINMTYKDLTLYAKQVKTLSDESYISGNKTDSYDVRIKSQNFTLQRHELGKLSETLQEATTSAMKGYELGLYL